MKLLVNKFLFSKFLLKNKVVCVVFFLIFLCSILLLVGFTLDGEEQQKALESKEKNISTVEKFEVYSSKLLQDISSFGTISYSEKNDVTVQVEGILKKLYVKEGDRVYSGQILAEMENLQLQIQGQQGESALKSAQAEVNLAKTRLEEGRLAVEGNLLNLEKLELQLQQQRLELEEAELELQNQGELLALGGITAAAYRSQEVALEGKKAAFKIALKEYERQVLGFRNQDLLENGIVPDENPETRRQQLVSLNTRSLQAALDSALANLDSAEKNLQSINEALSHLVIRSPKEGIVAVNYFEQGEFLSGKEKLLTVMDIDEVHAVFSIQEQDIGYFSVGSPVEVEVPSLGVRIKAPIKEISPVADSQSGNFTLKSYLKNENRQMKPGMFVKCILPRESSSFPTIPESALVGENKIENKQWVGEVFIIHQGRVVKKDVEVLGKSDGMIWISEGLQAGDLIVDNPSPFLKEGQDVN